LRPVACILVRDSSTMGEREREKPYLHQRNPVSVCVCVCASTCLCVCPCAGKGDAFAALCMVAYVLRQRCCVIKPCEASCSVSSAPLNTVCPITTPTHRERERDQGCKSPGARMMKEETQGDRERRYTAGICTHKQTHGGCARTQRRSLGLRVRVGGYVCMCVQVCACAYVHECVGSVCVSV
jgi:hypothetical protein